MAPGQGCEASPVHVTMGTSAHSEVHPPGVDRSGSTHSGATPPGTSALLAAAHYGHVEVAKVLLAAGAEVDQRSNVSCLGLGWVRVGLMLG